jgi:hypothetical protein
MECQISARNPWMHVQISTTSAKSLDLTMASHRSDVMPCRTATLPAPRRNASAIVLPVAMPPISL